VSHWHTTGSTLFYFHKISRTYPLRVEYFFFENKTYEDLTLYSLPCSFLTPIPNTYTQPFLLQGGGTAVLWKGKNVDLGSRRQTGDPSSARDSWRRGSCKENCRPGGVPQILCRQKAGRLVSLESSAPKEKEQGHRDKCKHLTTRMAR
jgi:hypothetical protein